MRMRVLFIVTTLVVLVSAASIPPDDKEFNDWKLEFGKIYKSAEEEAQRKIYWLENRKMILEHNKLADKGLKSFRLGLNQFADKAPGEKIC